MLPSSSFMCMLSSRHYIVSYSNIGKVNELIIFLFIYIFTDITKPFLLAIDTNYFHYNSTAVIFRIDPITGSSQMMSLNLSSTNPIYDIDKKHQFVYWTNYNRVYRNLLYAQKEDVGELLFTRGILSI